jgi:hypothetical protein
MASVVDRTESSKLSRAFERLEALQEYAEPTGDSTETDLENELDASAESAE